MIKHAPGSVSACPPGQEPVNEVPSVIFGFILIVASLKALEIGRVRTPWLLTGLMNSKSANRIKHILMISLAAFASLLSFVCLSSVPFWLLCLLTPKVLIDITGSTSRFRMSLLDFNMNKCSPCLINRIIG